METFKSLKESWYWLDYYSIGSFEELKKSIKNAKSFNEHSATLASWDALRIFGDELFFLRGWDSELEVSDAGAYQVIDLYSVDPKKYDSGVERLRNEFDSDPKIKEALHKLDEILELCGFGPATIEDHDGFAVGFDYPLK